MVLLRKGQFNLFFEALLYRHERLVFLLSPAQISYFTCFIALLLRFPAFRYASSNTRMSGSRFSKNL